MSQPLQLYWKEQHVGDVTDARTEDFPWVSGNFKAVDLTPDIRTALEWLAEMAEADELEDPPFDEQLMENWSLSSPTGERAEVSVPLVDFEAETIEWR